MTKTPKEQRQEDAVPHMDDVLKRMLSTPPKQHKDERVNPKPPSAKTVVQKKRST